MSLLRLGLSWRISLALGLSACITFAVTGSHPIRTSNMSSEHYYGRVAAGERPGNNSSMQLWSATSGARTATATATAATFPAATTSIIGGEGTASTTARTPDADAMFNDAALLLNAAARASREVSAAAPPGIASGAKHQPKNDEGKAEATRVVSMINGFPHELYAILPDAKTMVKVRIKVRVDIVGLPIFTCAHQIHVNKYVLIISSTPTISTANYDYIDRLPPRRRSRIRERRTRICPPAFSAGALRST